MAGIFTDAGVAAASARNAQANPSMVNGCLALYYSTGRCQSRFDPAQANAVMSEIVNLVNCGGTPYDCTRLDNLCTAVRDLAEDVFFGCLRRSVPDQGAACTVRQLVLSTDANGCTRLATYNEQSAQVASVSNASVAGTSYPFEFRPTDPNNAGSFYNRDDLVTDIQNNAVNNGKLGPNHLFSASFTLDCPGTFDIIIETQVGFNPPTNSGNGAEAEIAIRVDGVWQIYSNGIPLITQSFTNVVARATLSGITFNFAAGPHTLDAFVIARSNAKPPAQVGFVGSATTTGGIMTVRRTIG